jgi:leader peptidase (prepilin peptidase)/N-methyltransferase
MFSDLVVPMAMGMIDCEERSEEAIPLFIRHCEARSVQAISPRMSRRLLRCTHNDRNGLINNLRLTELVKASKIGTAMESMWIVLFALLGMSIASFLGVCIDRLPDNRSLLFPASHCPSCHHRLAIKDLIPVFSYLWLRGRCRYCKAAIPRRLLWLEIGTGILFAYLYWRFGLTPELAATAFYCCLFIVLAAIDLEHGLILNKIVYPSIVAALLISLFLPQPGIARAAIGGGSGLALFLAIAIIFKGGMGWGDVKMAALIGVVTGFPLIFVALFLAVSLGGLVALLLLLLKVKKRKESVPFAPFLSLATIATLLWGDNILNWYQGLF